MFQLLNQNFYKEKTNDKATISYGTVLCAAQMTTCTLLVKADIQNYDLFKLFALQ